MYQYGDSMDKWREHIGWWVYFYGYCIKKEYEKAIDIMFPCVCDNRGASENINYLLRKNMIYRLKEAVIYGNITIINHMLCMQQQCPI